MATFRVGRVGGERLNVRSGPSVSAAVLGTLAEGTTVEASDETTLAGGRGWRRVARPVAGFVADEFLDRLEDGRSEATGKFRVARVGAEGLNLRSAPSLSAARIGVLAEGTVVEAEGGTTPADGRAWRHILSPRDGFVADDFLDRVVAGGPIDGGRHEGPYVFPVQGYAGAVNLHHGQERGGADLMAPRGMAIVAMRGGLVDGAGFGRISGNFVSIVGDDGLDYWYAHGDDAPAVAKGQTVRAGTFLFPVGDSGNAVGTGTHLHIGIGHGINEGAGPSGGCGLDFDAVDLLRRVLHGDA